MLNADGLGKPCAPLLDGSRKGEAREPVPEAYSFLRTYARKEIRRSRAPLVVANSSVQRQDTGAGVRVLRPISAGFDSHSLHCIDVKPRGERSVCRVIDLETVQQDLSLSLSRPGDVN